MSIHLDLIEQFSENIIKQLFLISSSGETNKAFQDNSQKIIENLKAILVRLKDEKTENEELEDELRELDSELFKLRLQFENNDKKYQEAQNRINKSKSEIVSLTDSYDKIGINLNDHQQKLENLKSKLKTLESNLSAKKSEKEVLEQKRRDNEEKHRKALSTHSKELDEFKLQNENNLKEFEQIALNKIQEVQVQWSLRLEELEKQFSEFKKNHFFSLFLIENSDEKIPELDIINILVKQQNCDLDELKNQIDLPPILALRTIKKMEVKEILKIDEKSNIVSLSEDLFNI